MKPKPKILNENPTAMLDIAHIYLKWYLVFLCSLLSVVSLRASVVLVSSPSLYEARHFLCHALNIMCNVLKDRIWFLNIVHRLTCTCSSPAFVFASTFAASQPALPDVASLDAGDLGNPES